MGWAWRYVLKAGRGICPAGCMDVCRNTIVVLECPVLSCLGAMRTHASYGVYSNAGCTSACTALLPARSCVARALAVCYGSSIARPAHAARSSRWLQCWCGLLTPWCLLVDGGVDMCQGEQCARPRASCTHNRCVHCVATVTGVGRG
jgi:hypothetical protein